MSHRSFSDDQNTVPLHFIILIGNHNIIFAFEAVAVFVQYGIDHGHPFFDANTGDIIEYFKILLFLFMIKQ